MSVKNFLFNRFYKVIQSRHYLIVEVLFLYRYNLFELPSFVYEYSCPHHYHSVDVRGLFIDTVLTSPSATFQFLI